MYLLATGVLLLGLAIGGDQIEGLSLVLEDGISVAANNDDDIKVL